MTYPRNSRIVSAEGTCNHRSAIASTVASFNACFDWVFVVHPSVANTPDPTTTRFSSRNNAGYSKSSNLPSTASPDPLRSTPINASS